MTRFTRWLLLLIGGMLLFGLFCFFSGLLLGLYFSDHEPHLPGVATPSHTGTATVVPTLPGLPAAPTGAATAAAPAAVRPGSVSVTTPMASVQVAPPKIGTGGAATPAVAAAAAKTEQPAAVAAAGLPAAAVAPGSSSPEGAAAAAAAATAAPFPVKQVADLQVGEPPDETPPSELRGSLTTGAEAAAVAAAQHPPPAASGSTTPPASAASPPAAATGNATPPTAAVAASTLPAPAASLKRAFAVRVGAYLDQGAAQRRALLMQQLGYQPLVLSSRRPEEGLTWYSVVLGQAKDLAAAHRQAERYERDRQQHPEIVSWSLAPPAAEAVAAPPPVK